MGRMESRKAFTSNHRRSNVNVVLTRRSMEKPLSRERYLLIVDEGAPRSSVEYLISCLKDGGLVVEEERLGDRDILVVGFRIGHLLIEAELCQIEKSLQNKEVEEFKISNLSRFEGMGDVDSMFTPGEKSFLLRSYMSKVKFSPDKFLNCGIKKFKADITLINGCIHSTPTILESITPIHTKEGRKMLWGAIKRSTPVLPVDAIRAYYGEEIAYYFAWMTFFTESLIPPAIFGIFLFFHRPTGITVDDSPYLPFYAFVIALWAIYFSKGWKRRESEFALRWNTSTIEKKESIRPEFYGETRISRVTDKPEKYFPAWKRYFLFLGSFALSVPFLLMAYGAMILSLNFNGYIIDKESPIYVASLSKFSEPGKIFAADSPYYGWIIPTISHSLVINILNKLYRSVATFCTNLENHRTEHSWDSSLIVKRVLFEVFDCFLPLFYIAFYQLNIVSLRRELVGLFWGDEIRRLLTECLIPYVTEKLQHYRVKKQLQKTKKTTGEKPSNFEVLENVLLEEYEIFDDYLEMVVQFGYATLFASAFPLCSAITVIFLALEGRSDIFKLMFIYRRPIVKRASSIGVWYNVLAVMVVLSMTTNCMLIGFSSEQLAVWVPDMYETIEGDQWIKPGYGRYIVGIVFSAEHLLILFAALAHFCVSNRPEWVKTELARREFRKEKELQELKGRGKATSLGRQTSA